MSLLTVAIPFSQESREHFQLAVRSVFAQTTPDWRLILIGDSARRELIELARAIQDPRVSVEGSSTRRGLAARLNESVSITQTQFYARMDADDVMLSTRFERHLEALTGPSAPDVVGGRAVVINEYGSPEGLLRESPKAPSSPEECLRSNGFTHPSVTGRTDWFSANPYNEQIGRAEDMELWLRTARVSRFAKDPDVVLYYRIPTAFNRKKAVRTAVDTARVIAGGTRVGSRLTAVAATGASALSKALVYAAMPKTWWPGVRSRRVEPLKRSELDLHEAELRAIGATPVRGWDA